MKPAPLPIDPLLPEIASELRRAGSLVLEAPPGAGKTTRVPPALLRDGAIEGEIIVLQPRRLPTRLAAHRVAEELGERVGETVGYQVRFEDVSGPKTRIRFVTEGILGRRLLSDPDLPGVGAVIVDEFHERHLAGDVALAQLRRLQRASRPDLQIAVMSATLDAGPVATYLGDCPRLRSEGKRFEVELEYLPAADERPLEQQVLSALKRLHAAGRPGDILVFLPGASEIRRAAEACEPFAKDHRIRIHPLHGDLPAAEQDRAVRPGPDRKLILSTNVAETSVTIEGVAIVIDSGLARIATHSPWSGLPALRVAKVSKASAIQRAGRAGRTGPGHCVRLYTRHDFETRPDYEVPEIRRLDLAETLLALRASGVDPVAFPFFEPPPAASREAADDLLVRIGAVDPKGQVTPIGRRLLQWPLHPRQGRIVVEAERRGVAQDGLALAALIGERDIRREARARFSGDRGGRQVETGSSDLLDMLERFRQAEAADFAPDRLRALSLDTGAAQAVGRVTRSLSRTLDRKATRPTGEAAAEQALLLSVLAGYPDRVARRRRPKAPDVVFVGGGAAVLSEQSVVREAELLVAVDAEERTGPRGKQVTVGIASAIEPEWLLEVFPDRIRDTAGLEWNPESRRVERTTRLSYEDLALEETRAPAPPSEETARVLADAALAAGIGRFVEPEALEQWRSRLAVMATAFPEKGFPVPDDAFFRSALAAACAGLRSFAELEQAPILDSLSVALSPEQARLLSSHAPERIQLPGGRQVKVHYEPGKPPWIESRLQDFFGMTQTPSVAGGRVPLVIHLLAPNQRAVQVTQDLAGFWERHYPSIRKELARKYPRHAWPDDPRHAQPPQPRGR